MFRALVQEAREVHQVNLTFDVVAFAEKASWQRSCLTAELNCQLPLIFDPEQRHKKESDSYVFLSPHICRQALTQSCSYPYYISIGHPVPRSRSRILSEADGMAQFIATECMSKAFKCRLTQAMIVHTSHIFVLYHQDHRRLRGKAKFVYSQNNTMDAESKAPA